MRIVTGGDRIGLILVSALAAVAVAACGSSAPASPSTSPAASVEASPSEQAAGSGPIPTWVPSNPEPTTAGAPGELPVDSIAAAATSVRMRNKPGTSGGTKVVRTLRKGDRVFVMGGPQDADGMPWYRVQPLPARADGDLPAAGWVAARSASGATWLKKVAVACPAEPVAIKALTQLQPLERLACFGAEPVTVRAQYLGCGVSEAVTIEPAWLTASSCRFGQGAQGMRAHDDPAGSLTGSLKKNAWYELSGAFDDPAAESCTWVGGSKGKLAADQVTLVCRSEFALADLQPVSGP